MSEPKNYKITHLSVNGINAKKSYAAFLSLLKTAIDNAPSTVEFTSPDIVALKKENDKLKADLDKAADALRQYADSRECGDGINKWNPIESAPRDGTKILLWIPKHEVCVSGCWDFIEGERDGFHVFYDGFYDWIIDDDLYLMDSPSNYPTHWMPLPANPPIEYEK